MKKRSQALLASAILAVGSAGTVGTVGTAGTAVPAEPPLKTLPSQRDIWITGTIERGSGPYAPGDCTTLRLDRPSTSPCDDKVVSDVLLGRAGVPDPSLMLPYLGQRVAVRGRVCPDSGIHFTPTPDVVFPIY